MVMTKDEAEDFKKKLLAAADMIMWQEIRIKKLEKTQFSDDDMAEIIVDSINLIMNPRLKEMNEKIKHLEERLDAKKSEDDKKEGKPLKEEMDDNEDIILPSVKEK